MSGFDRLAARASADPTFAGYVLREFATAHCLTNAALAAWLGMTAEQLTHLRICGAPRHDADLREFAAKCGASLDRLREVFAA